MELDLLGESESDSDESAHSHADNASIQRSAVTAATAGSDAGMSVCDVAVQPTMVQWFGWSYGLCCLSLYDVGALWINAYKNRVGFWREGCYRGQLVRCGSSSAHGNEDLLRDGLLDLDIVWLPLCHGRQYQQLLICRL